jgi:hypothetical protein
VIMRRSSVLNFIGVPPTGTLTAAVHMFAQRSKSGNHPSDERALFMYSKL